MSTFEELHGRIAAAMDRIQAGIERSENAPDDGRAEQLAQLEAALQAAGEREAALQDEISALSARAERVPELEAALVEAHAASGNAREVLGAVAGLENELGRLRAANEVLRSNNRALREAVSQGTEAGTELLSQSAEAELDALRADQTAAKAQADAILAALAPMVAESQSEAPSETETS